MLVLACFQYRLNSISYNIVLDVLENWLCLLNYIMGCVCFFTVLVVFGDLKYRLCSLFYSIVCVR